MTLITMKNSSSMITAHCQVVPRLEWTELYLVPPSTYMPLLCGQGNFSSMIIININGDECPVDPDDINSRGEYRTLCYFKK